MRLTMAALAFAAVFALAPASAFAKSHGGHGGHGGGGGGGKVMVSKKGHHHHRGHSIGLVGVVVGGPDCWVVTVRRHGKKYKEWYCPY